MVNIAKAIFPILQIVYFWVALLNADVGTFRSITTLSVVEGVNSSVDATLDSSSACGHSILLFSRVFGRVFNKVTWNRLISIHIIAFLVCLKAINVMINVQILSTLILTAPCLFLRIRSVITLPHKFIVVFTWFGRHSNWLGFFILGLGGGVHLVLACWLHFLVHGVHVLTLTLFLLA